MSRITLSHRIPTFTRLTLNATTRSRTITSSSILRAGSQNSTPGWSGRTGDDHATKRSPHDVQADASKAGMEDKQSAPEGADKEGGQGISQKDERNANQRAHDEHPEAPGPVIGMNSERGAKGH